MSAKLVHKNIPKELYRALELGEFRELNDLALPTHFGNELLTYASPSINLRLVKDRGQWRIDLGPADLSGEWHSLEDVISAATGSEPRPLPPNIDSLGEALLENFPKIQQSFANYEQNRDVLKRITASRSEALLKETFPGFKNG